MLSLWICRINILSAAFFLLPSSALLLQTHRNHRANTYNHQRAQLQHSATAVPNDHLPSSFQSHPFCYGWGIWQGKVWVTGQATPRLVKDTQGGDKYYKKSTAGDHFRTALRLHPTQQVASDRWEETASLCCWPYYFAVWITNRI